MNRKYKRLKNNKIREMKTRIEFYQRIGKPIKHWKNLITCLVLIITLTACTQRNTVIGHIEGLTNDTIFMDVSSLEFFEDDPVQDTIIAKNGRFEYAFQNNGMYGLYFSFPQFFVLNMPSGGLFAPNNSHLIVFAEQGNKIHLKGKTNSRGLSNVIVSGSELNRDFSPIQNKTFEININQVKEEMAFEQAMEDNNKEEYAIGFAKRMERLNARRELYSNYIKENLDNPLSAFLLIQQPLDSIGKYYDQLGENARHSPFRYALESQVEQYQEYINVMNAKERIVAGTKAPDFTLEDMNGKPFTLSSLLGKYVIIDFWGSWCGPCIAGIPKMKGVYKKYKDKLEILGVAYDEKSVDIWRNAVIKYELPWINVYDNLLAVKVEYGIVAAPTKIVIDLEGTILIIEQGEGKDFYTKLESVIK